MKYTILKPLALTGMMGSGKTHIGRMLSHECGLPFYDSDALITERAGMSIPMIFEKFGEEKFRTSERNVIEEILSGEPCILSTGGGAVTNPGTLKALKDKSHLIWVDAPLEIIWDRVKDCTNRPLLQTDNPKATLTSLLQQRLPLYQQAHFRLDNDGMDNLKRLHAVLSEISS